MVEGSARSMVFKVGGTGHAIVKTLEKAREGVKPRELYPIVLDANQGGQGNAANSKFDGRRDRDQSRRRSASCRPECAGW